MDAWLPLVRAAHVAAVVLWIGGVGFVTTVLLPGVRAEHPPSRRLAAFLRFERRFVWQARALVAVVGVTGVEMLRAYHLWARLRTFESLWLHARIGVWLVFAMMLFVLEPLVLHRALARARAQERAFARVAILHWVLFSLSLATVAFAVAGAHGLG
jgi:uncharacterized membrane protein